MKGEVKEEGGKGGKEVLGKSSREVGEENEKM